MCLPQLYSNVALHSYDHVRFTNLDGYNLPEAVGGASPFAMGLNALVTRNVANYVRKFKVCGKWKDYDLEEYAKVGRVPDGSMMLNMLVRASLDRMSALDSFTYF